MLEQALKTLPDYKDLLLNLPVDSGSGQVGPSTKKSTDIGS